MTPEYAVLDASIFQLVNTFTVAGMKMDISDDIDVSVVAEYSFVTFFMLCHFRTHPSDTCVIEHMLSIYTKMPMHDSARGLLARKRDAIGRYDSAKWSEEKIAEYEKALEMYKEHNIDNALGRIRCNIALEQWETVRSCERCFNALDESAKKEIYVCKRMIALINLAL